MNKFIGEKTKLECKEGMLMHPFLDNSGLVFLIRKAPLSLPLALAKRFLNSGLIIHNVCLKKT